MISRSSRGGTDSGPRTSDDPAELRNPRGLQPVAALRETSISLPLIGRWSRRCEANGGAAAERELSEFGKHWGSAAMAERGRLANENIPKLRSFDAKGNRRDQVEFHPAYHELMAHSAHAGVHNSTWTAEGTPAGDAAEVIRAAKFYIAAQVETGHLCPITMTRASVAALAVQPDLRARVMPVLSTKSYDPELRAMVGQARHDARHGHDREAGRHGCARQHDARGARWRCLSHHRPQMVHVGADVRCVPGAGAGRAGADLLLHAALCAGWLRQCDPVPAAERQARQSLQCVLRGRVRRRLRRSGLARKARASAPSSRWCS